MTSYDKPPMCRNCGHHKKHHVNQLVHFVGCKGESDLDCGCSVSYNTGRCSFQSSGRMCPCEQFEAQKPGDEFHDHQAEERMAEGEYREER